MPLLDQVRGAMAPFHCCRTVTCAEREKEKEKERERERDKHTQRERYAERQSERYAERQSERERERSRQTDRHRERGREMRVHVCMGRLLVDLFEERGVGVGKDNTIHA